MNINRMSKFLSNWYAPLTLVAFLGFLWYIISLMSQSSKPITDPRNSKKEEKVQLMEFEKKIDSLNNRLSFLSLTSVVDPLIYEYAKPSYILEMKRAVKGDSISPYYFDVFEYGIHSINNQISRCKLDEVCEILNKISDPSNKEFSVEQMLSKIETEMEYELPSSLKFKAKNLHIFIWELLFASKSITDMNLDSCKILIRGFADGETGKWDRNLNSSPYDYHNIKYFPVHQKDKGRDYVVYYSNKKKPHKIGNKYSNSDLPYLRGQYVEDEFLSRVYDLCHPNIPLEIGQIEGKEFKDKLNRPDQRKVEIFIQIYF